MTAKKPTKKAPKPPKAGVGEPALTRFQAFTMKRMHRREIKGWARNPRTITPENKKRLKAILDSDNGGMGLLGPVTVNEVSGALTSGHQRLSLLDALEGHDNYLLDVAVVRLGEAEEAAAVIAMNNDRAQGDWDLGLLADVLKTPGLDLELTAFSALDISLNFDDPELAGLFAPNDVTADLLSEVAAQGEEASAARAGRAGAGKTSDGEGSDAEADAKPGKREIMKATRARNAENFADDDTAVYAIVVMRSRAERGAFCTHFGQDPDVQYIDGDVVMAKLNLGLVPSKRAEPEAKPKAKRKGAA